MHVVETAAIAPGSMPVLVRTSRTQLLASSQLCVQSKSMLPGQRGSSRCVHSFWTTPTCVPSVEKITARTLPVPASIARRYFSSLIVCLLPLSVCLSVVMRSRWRARGALVPCHRQR